MKPITDTETVLATMSHDAILRRFKTKDSLRQFIALKERKQDDDTCMAERKANEQQ